MKVGLLSSLACLRFRPCVPFSLKRRLYTPAASAIGRRYNRLYHNLSSFGVRGGGVNHQHPHPSNHPPHATTVIVTMSAEDDDNSRADAAAFNSYASAAVDLSNAHVSDQGLLTVTRSCRDVDTNTRRKLLYTIPMTLLDVELPPVEVNACTQFRLPSPSGETIAIFKNRVIGSGESDQTTTTTTTSPVLELWTRRGQLLQQTIELSTQHTKRHGKVVSDPSGGFGVPSWNEDETVLVYTADRKSVEAVSFFEQSSASNDGAVIGAQHERGMGKEEHWGEKYYSNSPLKDLWCINVTTGRVGRVDNVPAECAVGQPVIRGTSIVYTGWDANGNNMPRRLGLIYCQQRPCQLYRSDVQKLLSRLEAENETDANVDEDSAFVSLTPEYRLSHSPRFVGKKLVFLTSVDGFETHVGCFGLALIDNVLHGKPNVIVEQVWNPNSSPASAGQVAGMRFPGLFLLQLPLSCALSQDFIVATTQWGSCTKVVRISLSNGEVRLLQLAENELSSDELMCVDSNGGVVVATKMPGTPATIHYIESDEMLGVLAEPVTCKELARMSPVAASKVSPVTQRDLIGSFDVHVTDPPAVEGVSFNNTIQSILILPDKAKHPKPPLIVVPHGGPHSASSTGYLPSYAYLCGYGGYAILLVNYRGSSGFGQGSIEALPTNIGTLDAEDVVSATEAVKASGLVGSKIGICGGSHGGFLTAHLTAQYPDLFDSAVMRNPVVNLCSMVTTTDIPDWCYVEALGSYHWNQYKPPSQDQLQTLYSKSPIQFINQVKTPTLVALGLRDLRVPPSQGLEWYHTLKSMGVPTKLLTYENDDHAIDGVASEADHWINIKRWFDEHLRRR